MVARTLGVRAGHRSLEEEAPYLISALAFATASVRACCGSTLLKRASCTALRTSWLTSGFLGMVGTMSAYVAMMSFASGRALSSIAEPGDEKIGSSKAFGEDGSIATCLLNSTMARGFVKYCARAMDAFGNFVSFLTEMLI